MQEMAISKFKATCLAVLQQVRDTGEPIVITKRGEPVAEIVPPSRPAAGKRVLGDLAGTGQITGDIISPVCDVEEWEAARD